MIGLELLNVLYIVYSFGTYICSSRLCLYSRLFLFVIASFRYVVMLCARFCSICSSVIAILYTFSRIVYAFFHVSFLKSESDMLSAAPALSFPIVFIACYTSRRSITILFSFFYCSAFSDSKCFSIHFLFASSILSLSLSSSTFSHSLSSFMASSYCSGSAIGPCIVSSIFYLCLYNENFWMLLCHNLENFFRSLFFISLLKNLFAFFIISCFTWSCSHESIFSSMSFISFSL